MRIATYCKRCRFPISIAMDDECPQIWIDKLLPMATCNKCADFQHKQRHIADRIRRICETLYRLRLDSDEKAAEYQAKAVPVMEQLGRDYTQNISDYYRDSRRFWDDMILDELVNRPEQWWRILKYISRIIEKEITSSDSDDSALYL